MHRGVLGLVLIVGGLAPVTPESPSPTPGLVAFTETVPERIDTFERRLAASSWCATPGNELAAAVILPTAGAERPMSEIVLFSSLEDAPESLTVPGLVPDIALSPAGDTLYAIQVRPRPRHDPAVRLIRIEVDSLRAETSISLGLNARALALWPAENTLLVGGEDEVRSFTLPEFRSGRVYPIRGSTRSLAVDTDGLLLIGQDDAILLVDPSRSAGLEGLAPLERIAVPSAVVDLSSGGGGRLARGRLLDGTWFEVRRDPLRIEVRGSAAGLLRVVQASEMPQAADEARRTGAIAVPPPTPDERLHAVPTAMLTDGESILEPPAAAASHQVWGRIAGSARHAAQALALLGPDSVAREALRVTLEADGGWFASGLAPGRYRLVPVGIGGRALSCSPPFATIDVGDETRSLRAPDFEIRGAR